LKLFKVPEPQPGTNVVAYAKRLQELSEEFIIEVEGTFNGFPL